MKFVIQRKFIVFEKKKLFVHENRFLLKHKQIIISLFYYVTVLNELTSEKNATKLTEKTGGNLSICLLHCYSRRQVFIVRLH